MSSNRADPRRGGLAALLGALALLLSGCGAWFGVADEPTEDERAAALLAGAEHHLEQRGRAITEERRRLFVRGLSRDRDLLASERRRFANLRRLPLQTLEYALVPDSFRDLGGEATALVERHLQLQGYDAEPVVTVKRFSWVTDGEDGEELRLGGVEPVAGQGSVDPWDAGAIRVRASGGVLGIFDPGSVGAAGDLLEEVRRGVAHVGADVPYDWDRRVVVYALSETDVLASIEDLPGGDPERLDAVAFPVRVHPESAQVADHRFLLHPRMLQRDRDSRSRLIRHELVHVALAHRDDRVPTWLAEGIAEYVSVRPVPEQQRTISREALDLATSGPDGMPSNEQFNGPRSGANYGLSWWACEYIADAYGEPMLWDLVDAFGRSDRDPDRVLRDALGIGSEELAGHAARLIVATFG